MAGWKQSTCRNNIKVLFRHFENVTIFTTLTPQNGRKWQMSKQIKYEKDVRLNRGKNWTILIFSINHFCEYWGKVSCFEAVIVSYISSANKTPSYIWRNYKLFFQIKPTSPKPHFFFNIVSSVKEKSILWIDVPHRTLYHSKIIKDEDYVKNVNLN